MTEIQGITPASAYWNHRHRLADLVPRLTALEDAIGALSDLARHQWAQLLAFALEARPTLIVELGRGLGNSTCVFLEAASQLPARSCRVLSLCNTNLWETESIPRLQKHMQAGWLGPLRALNVDILEFDFESALASAERVFLFWDAHGFEIAECVLGRVLPLLAGRPHVVAMHDLSDARYLAPSIAAYGPRSLWKGSAATGARVRLGHIDSAVAQAVAALDFCSRNMLTFESADHSYHAEIGALPERCTEMKQLLGDLHFSLNGDWFWFTLNEKPGPYTFPTVSPLRR